MERRIRPEIPGQLSVHETVIIFHHTEGKNSQQDGHFQVRIVPKSYLTTENPNPATTVQINPYESQGTEASRGYYSPRRVKQFSNTANHKKSESLP